MGRGNQIARQWTLIQCLDSHRRGVTIADLAKDLNCSPRTIYRDLDDLQAAGFPITNEMIEGSNHWQFIDGYRASLPTPFALNELMSLYLSRDLLQALQGTFFYDSIQNLIQKIAAQLGPAMTSYLNSTEHAFAAGSGPVGDYKAHRELLHLLNDACLKKEVVKFRYYSRKNEHTMRKVNPYKVYFYQGTLYLIGFDQKREAMRMFVIDRIKLLQKTGEKFVKMPKFDVREYLKHSFGVMREEQLEISLRIHAKIARFIAEKKWHESQKTHKNKDGSMDFSFLVAGTKEIKQWILSLGPMATVTHPTEFIEEIVQDLEQTLHNYKPHLKAARIQAG